MFESVISSVVNDCIDILDQIYKYKTIVYKNKIFTEQGLMNLMDFLEQHKFPIESFDLQCPVSKYFAKYAQGMTPDLTIIDPNTMQPLAFFRVYDSENDLRSDKLIDDAYHFNRRSSELALRPYYIVINNENSLCFYNIRTILTHLNNGVLDPSLALYEPLKFTVLQNNSNYKIIRNKIIDKSKLENIGKIAFSVIIPLISIIILILDEKEIFQLNELRLIVYGITIVAALIPYLTQITIKDFSISLRDKKEK